ncbi:hypothetical protein [Streptomyces hokutonensis]|uniref:HEAT repeat domain-containing protein n=1 Tax=Streptomyces hokutonensis TaxID=1306990 RepID=A0ABW6MJK7_9ACTN
MRADIRRGVAAAVRLAQGESVRDVLDVRDPRAWVGLDTGARVDEFYCPPGVVPWERTAGGREFSEVLRGPGPLTESQLALALCHRDGRIRQAALDRVTGHPVLLPLVVLRCAEWAPPVRDRARQRLAESLDALTAGSLAPMILLVGRRNRADFAVRLLDETLRRAPRDRIITLCSSADRAVRRYAYRLAVEDGLLSPAELARAAARDTDTVVQTFCADAALAAVAKGGAYDEVFGPLLGARSPRVRSAGVTVLRPAGRTGLAVGFLADRAAVVRACARYVVRRDGVDPLPLYRAWCATSEPVPGAVIGLAECGGRADAELLWTLVGHPTGAVRAQAVAGLRVLDVADVRRLWPLLDDPAAGVVRELTAALLPSAELVPEEWLTERLGAGWPRPVRGAAFRLLDARGGGVRRRAAEALSDDPDVKLRGWAEHAVKRG